MKNPPSGAEHMEKRMTEKRLEEHRIEGVITAPPREDGSSPRSKMRNKARDAAKAAAEAARANKEVEDVETAKAIRNARKEAGK